MPPVQCEQLLGAGLCTGLAADEVNPLEAGLLAADLEDFALDAGNLSRMRKFQIVVEPLAGPDAACFDAAMRLLDSDVLRGERPPCGGLRCRL
jgi:hypothetical protein